jgi:hypothetical protein
MWLRAPILRIKIIKTRFAVSGVLLTTTQFNGYYSDFIKAMDQCSLTGSESKQSGGLEMQY